MSERLNIVSQRIVRARPSATGTASPSMLHRGRVEQLGDERPVPEEKEVPGLRVAGGRVGREQARPLLRRQRPDPEGEAGGRVVGLLDASIRKRKRSPSGRISGNRWDVSPPFVSSVVTATAVPPAAGTRKIGSVVEGVKRIVPSRVHAPPRPTPPGRAPGAGRRSRRSSGASRRRRSRGNGCRATRRGTSRPRSPRAAGPRGRRAAGPRASLAVVRPGDERDPAPVGREGHRARLVIEARLLRREERRADDARGFLRGLHEAERRDERHESGREEAPGDDLAPPLRTGVAGATGTSPASPASMAASASRASPTSRSRLFGLRSRQRRRRSWSAGGVAGGSFARSISLLRTPASVSLTVSAAKSWRPVSISWRTTPNAQMSARLSTVPPAPAPGTCRPRCRG